MTAPTAQMMMDLTPATVPQLTIPAAASYRKRRITLVEVLVRDVPWYEKQYTDAGEWTKEVIAVYRDHSRMFHAYEKRSGLRHERLLRIIGRH